MQSKQMINLNLKCIQQLSEKLFLHNKNDLYIFKNWKCLVKDVF